MPRRVELVAGILACMGALGCAPESEPEEPAYLSVEPAFSGSETCVRCHQDEFDRWRGSHHDLAMQPALEETVLGDFDDATFEHYGVTTTFSRRGDEFWVRTEGADGEPADFRITHAFGVEPLQQYLIEFPDGRLQALSMVWDARPESANGQRWVHVYGDEEIPWDDALHWTGPNQNWNYMCAECHSTDLEKNYDAESDTYDTQWAEIDVACESCHGPGSRHLAWAEEVGDAPDPAATAEAMGLLIGLRNIDQVSWDFGDDGIARRQPARVDDTEVEACGRCHSRRSVIRDPYVYAQPLLDTHRVSLLTPSLYHPDGQILDEVYVYGSFLQSRMYAEGVTCSDCHDPHTTKLFNQGNALCFRCHQSEKYDTIEHHHHPVDNEPSTRCVACHMRTETYMVVDPRHDHSFRVPRPDLSLEIGSPNACTDCHRETSPEWAAERFAEWWPERARQRHYGQAFHAAIRGEGDVGGALRSIAEDPQQSAIVRATAVSRLADYMDTRALGTVERASRDAAAIVRMAAASALDALDPATGMGLGRALLDDPVLAVRIEAARALSPLPIDQLEAGDAAALEAALDDLRQAQLVNADRPEAHIVLGALYAQRGQAAEARAEYSKALDLDPASTATLVNLADLHRQTGDDSAAENVLRRALTLEPDNADVHHALGLTLVRQGRAEEAMSELGRAAELDPYNLRYGYVHAVAAHSTGRVPKAIRLLEGLHERWPQSPDVLAALANYYASLGGFAEAEVWARKLVELAPQNPQAQALLQQIQSRQ